MRCLNACSDISLQSIRRNNVSTHPAVLGTLVGDETDDNEGNDGDTSEYSQTNRENGELGTRELELGRRTGFGGICGGGRACRSIADSRAGREALRADDRERDRREALQFRSRVSDHCGTGMRL